jgi:hypothetical protein
MKLRPEEPGQDFCVQRGLKHPLWDHISTIVYVKISMRDVDFFNAGIEPLGPSNNIVHPSRILDILEHDLAALKGCFAKSDFQKV